MTEHVLDTAIALQHQGGDRFIGQTSPAYANFIGPYGGVTAAQALHAVLRHPQLLGEPVAFTINYAAALSDGAFDVVARPARTNRSTQHWTIALEQQGQVVATATAFTALRRETYATHEASMPAVPRPADVPPAAGKAKVEWVNRYEMRFMDGGMPPAWDGRDSGHSRTRLWVRDQPPRPLDFASLAAMADVFFPRIWLRRASFVPVGTVTMTVYFHATSQGLRESGEGYVMAQAQGQGFGGGYFDHSAQLWNEAGALLATTHQVVYFKE